MQLRTIVEALVTASGEALSSAEIARLVRARVAEAEDQRARRLEEGEDPEALPEWLAALGEVDETAIRTAIEELNQGYEQAGHAFLLGERARGWRLYTRPEFGEFTALLFPGRKPERLSAPAMETLAIVAYRQPITKAAIEAVRGVSCDGMLQKLLDRELIRIGGRAELPGRPLLYETTELFYEHFGIRSIDDLPNAGELRKVPLPEPTEEAPEGSPEEQLALGAGEKSETAEAAEPDATERPAEHPAEHPEA